MEMRVLFIVQLSIALSDGSVIDIRRYGVNFNLEKKLALEAINKNPKVNMVVSSLLLRYPLCKLASIATGAAKHQLMATLGLDEDSMINTCCAGFKEPMSLLKEGDLTLVNRIYVNSTYNIEQSFLTNMTEMYGMQLDKVGFEYPKTAMNYINRWIESSTLRRIQNLLEPDDVNKNSSMILVNAAHLKCSWESAFDIRLTKSGKFRRLDSSVVTVPMMTKFNEYLYLDDSGNDFKLVTAYLVTWGASITIVVPNMVTGLPKLLDKIYQNPDLLKKARTDSKYEFVKLVLPRFRIKTSVVWNELLKNIGLNKIFDNSSSGLEGILKQDGNKTNIYLSRAKQRNFIDVDEFGTKRTVDLYEPADDFRKLAGLKVKDVVVDKPFLFTINIQESDKMADEGRSRYSAPKVANSYELFVGVYYGPE